MIICVVFEPPPIQIKSHIKGVNDNVMWYNAYGLK